MGKIENKVAKVINIDSAINWRGGQQQAVLLHEGLLSHGVESTFFTKNNSAVHNYLTSKSIDVNCIDMNNEVDIKSAIKLALFAKRNFYNIIICHCSHSLSIALLSRLFNSNLNILAVRRVDNKINNIISKNIKYGSSHLSKIVCVSNAILNTLIKSGLKSDKLTVIYDGIDIEKHKNYCYNQYLNFKKTDNTIVIGTIAAMENEKDYPTFLQAIRLISQKKDNVRFIALGDGSLRKEIEQKSKIMGIDKDIHFVGYKKNIDDYLSQFDIFTLISKREGLGTSLLEAMSTGLPVVGTRVGGIPEVIKEGINGLLVEKSNPKELANALIELIDNKDKRKMFGINSLEVVKDFSIKRNIQEYVNLFDEVLSNRE